MPYSNVYNRERASWLRLLMTTFMIVSLLMPIYPAQARIIEEAPADNTLSPAPQIAEADSESSPLFKGTIDFPSSGDRATSNLQTGGIPEISIAKVAQSPVIPSGSNAIFTIAITNTSTGGLDLDNITIDDPHCDSNPPPITSDGNGDSTLDNGESWTYTCTVSNVQMGFINTVTATGNAVSGGTAVMPAVTSAKVMVSETINACMVDGISATISHWPFGEAGEPYNDIVSGHDALVGGNQLPAQVTGVVGGGQQFDGTDDGLEAPSPPGNTDYDWSEDEDFSIEIWARADAGSCATQNEVFIGRRQQSGASWWLGCTSGNGLGHFDLRAPGGSGNQIALDSTDPITDGGWHHLVAVRDALGSNGDGFVRLYVDGVEVESKLFSPGNGFEAPGAPVTLGWFDSNNTFNFDGSLDEPAIYGEALSPDVIEKHYQKGLRGFGTCDLTPHAPDIYSTPVTEAKVQTLYNYDVNATGYPTTTYGLQAPPGGMSIDTDTGLISWTPAVAQKGVHSVTVRATNTGGFDDQTYNLTVSQDTICLAGTLSYWTLDETAGTTYADFFSGHDGAAGAGTPTPVIAGKVNGGQSFDGIDDEIDVPAHSDFDFGVDDSFSIELWMKADPAACSDTVNEVFIGRRDGNTLQWWLGCLASGPDIGQANFKLKDINTGPGPGNIDLTSTSVITDGEWHHIVGVREASGSGGVGVQRIYVDGNLEATIAATYTVGFASATEPINIGWLPSAGANNFHFAGDIDEVAIYNTALSDAEVQANYNRTNPGTHGYCYNPGLTMFKTPDDQTIIGGSTVTFSVTISNTSDFALTNLTVSDPAFSTCNTTIPMLAEGAATSYECGPAVVNSTFTNIATVTANFPTVIADTISASDSAKVTAKNPDLALSKTANAPTVAAGSTVTFTLVVSNTGDDDLQNIDLVDSECGLLSGPNGDDDMDNELDQGEIWTYTCSLSNVLDDIVNTATVTGTSASVNTFTVSDSDSAAVDVVSANIQIEKTPALQYVRAGMTAGFTITVTNISTDANLSNVIVTDLHPLAADCDNSFVALNAGASQNYTCTTDPLFADMTNDIQAVGTLLSSQTVTDTDTALVDVITPSIALDITPANQNIDGGTNVTFTLIVTNTGDSPLSNINLNHNSTCDALSGGSSDLNAGQASTYTCTINNVTVDLTLNASVTGTPLAGPNVSDNASATVSVAGIEITKLPDTQTINAGDTAVFTVTVANMSGVDLTNVSVVDPRAPDCDNTIASLPNGGSPVTYTCSLNNVSASFTNIITATAASPVSVSDSDSADVTVISDFTIYLPVVIK